MRLLKFIEPNFRCKVRDAGGNIDVRLEHAASEAEVRQRLLDKGYTIEKIDNYKFSEWAAKARNETESALLAKIRIYI